MSRRIARKPTDVYSLKYEMVRPIWEKQRKLSPGRLRKVANFLEDLPDENFDMNHWMEKGTCGTSGCIAGWTTTLPFAKN